MAGDVQHAISGRINDDPVSRTNVGCQFKPLFTATTISAPVLAVDDFWGGPLLRSGDAAVL